MNPPPSEPSVSLSDRTAQAPGNPLADVKQLGMWASIKSLGFVFWVVGAMEMIERLAYYGVRAVATLYATRPVSEHGLGVTMATFGTLLMTWNLVQSLVPVFTGGLSDRYGYKPTIFLSTALKCLGYLIMAWWQTYAGFFVGAMFLAVGTAIFKPGIQGTLIRATHRLNSSMAWGIFYQAVNIGGWIGPLVALHMRSHMGWQAVFYTNAAVICLNFLLLLTYREPGLEERLARRARIRAGLEREQPLWRESLAELRKPHLTVYLAIFSVWWLMFPMLWDVLPRYVEDWVDTRPMVTFLFGADGAQNAVAKFLLGMDAEGRNIQPEGIVNINAGMIMLTCFVFAGLSARMRATDSLLVGTLLVATALMGIGLTRQVGWIVLALVVFSIGEMLASPKYSEFLGNVAPPDKKAMWIGFSQAPILIGWTLEGKLGPWLYHHFSDKDRLARRTLVEALGWSPDSVSEAVLPVGEAFRKLVEVTGQSPEALTRELLENYPVGLTWYVFAGVGFLTAVMIGFYGRWIRELARRPMQP
ncbi:peptide MFS transporter [Limisphaera ngatamarikiensis]|uniref:Peptide MFS transporter n=1 Tax=Limisphaera ngatamarikiensis TaxID=1324935 RepID=A0A6M1RMH4_9BACT|nr:MFS transporter [Limisphaera ngatamarikiensis]NGO38893.1 peptide MFS transporter [Limisphaera ngatamarikiensis]